MLSTFCRIAQRSRAARGPSCGTSGRCSAASTPPWRCAQLCRVLHTKSGGLPASRASKSTHPWRTGPRPRSRQPASHRGGGAHKGAAQHSAAPPEQLVAWRDQGVGAHLAGQADAVLLLALVQLSSRLVGSGKVAATIVPTALRHSAGAHKPTVLVQAGACSLLAFICTACIVWLRPQACRATSPPASPGEPVHNASGGERSLPLKRCSARCAPQPSSRAGDLLGLSDFDYCLTKGPHHPPPFPPCT